MIFLLLILLISIFAFFVYIASKNSYLRVDLKNGQIWVLYLYREVLMIFLALLLVSLYGLDAFEDAILNTRAEDLLRIYLWSIYAIFVFWASLLFFSVNFKIPVGSEYLKNAIEDHRVRRFANAALIAGGILAVFSVIFFSYQHALIASLLSGDSLLRIRLENNYQSKLPSQIAQLITISWWIGSVYLGVLFYRREKFQAFFYAVVVFLLASMRGDKAPIITCILLVSFSYYSISGFKFSVDKLFKYFVFFLPSIYFLIYFIVSLQIPDLSLDIFNIYLLNRLGVGQMSGVFETFSISRIDGDFFWHIIPGASFFVDYIPYDKALMMVTEGYGFAEMGVKNSLFISEAYGIGGMLLVFFSPLIVGASYGLGIFLLYFFLTKFFGRAVAIFYGMPIYILSSSLTGGFSSFPLFKGLILGVLNIGLIWIVYQLLRLSLRKNAS